MRWGNLIIPGDGFIIWLYAIVSGLLLVLLLFWAWRRANRRRLALRLAASFLAVLSLLAIALQPCWLSSPNPSGALLITPGAETSRVKSLIDSLHLSAVFSVDGAHPWKSIYEQVQVIPDAAYLQRHGIGAYPLHVVGYGLHQFDWCGLDSIRIEPHLAPLSHGIKHAHWKTELYAGERLVIQGRLSGVVDDESIIYLRDPGEMMADSARLAVDGESNFQLQATPHEVGRHLYTMVMKSSDGQPRLEHEIGVSVIEPPPLRVLILEAAPRFETKHLKNWLSARHGSLAIRTTISKERYRFEYLNLKPHDLNRLTSRLLQNFDIVIIDGRTLRAMAHSERYALRVAVEQEGLGILLIPDDALLTARNKKFSEHDFFIGFRLEEFADLDQRLIKPILPGFHKRDMTPIPAEPYAIAFDWGMRTLLKDEKENLVAVAYHRGRGLVGLGLIRESYRWVLEGNAKYHAAYWTQVLSVLARQDKQRDRWRLQTNMLPIIDRPVQILIESSNPHPVGLVATDADKPDSVFMQQSLVDSQRWFGTYWPRQSGWHRVATTDGAPFWFYVYKKTSWLVAQQAQKMEATRLHAARNANLLNSNLLRNGKFEQSMPLYWVFIAFISSSAYLWFQRKLANRN